MQAIFGSGSGLSWWQECDRAIVILIYGLIMVRLSGPRTFAKWGALDTVVSIIVGSNLSRAITGSAPLGGTLAASTLIFVTHWAMAKASAHWPAASRLLEGTPDTIVRNGVADHGRRLLQAVSHNDIREALHEKALRDIAEAAEVIVEPSGKINVIKAGG